MGKALAIIGLILLLLVGSCVGCMWWGYNKVVGVQDDFYAVVATGDAGKVKAQFSPKVQIDDAQLAAWVKAINEQLGAYTGMAMDGGFDVNANADGGGEDFRVAGKAEFEKGTARSIVRTLDGKVVGLKVESDLPGVSIELGDVGKASSGGDEGGNAGGGNDGDEGGNAGGGDEKK